MSNIKAIIFDLDGTLLDTIDDIAGSANYALSRLGYPTHAVCEYMHFVGNGVDALIRRMLPEGARTAEIERAAMDIYLPRYEEHSFDATAPYDGITELLDELARSGKKLAVVSNKQDDAVQSIVSSFFGNRFDYVTGAPPGGPFKPDPAAALRAMRQVGATPKESLFVGDTGVDMQTGKNAGCTAVGVAWGFRTRAELEENGADIIIDSPLELTALIERSDGR